MYNIDSPERILPLCNDPDNILQSDRSHMTEWHYKGDLFITHRQASRNIPLDSPRGKIWKERINIYMQSEYGVTL